MTTLLHYQEQIAFLFPRTRHLIFLIKQDGMNLFKYIIITELLKKCQALTQKKLLRVLLPCYANFQNKKRTVTPSMNKLLQIKHQFYKKNVFSVLATLLSNKQIKDFCIQRVQGPGGRDVAAAPQTPNWGGGQANFGGPS